MENIFKLNDRVFHISYGWGSVIRSNDKLLAIHFDSQKEPHLLLDSHRVNLISFTEYTLQGFSQERPETLPEKGQVVWVRDDEDDEWLISHFVEQNGNFYGTTDANPFVGIIETNWRYLTTKNPYENEK